MERTKFSEPVVSIITPCYNGEQFVDRYFQSILNQTYQNIELIFINDGSIDRTEDIAMSYKEEFAKKGISYIYIYQNNGGVASALNRGLKIFTGDYLTWPDSDDILHPENISKKVEYLEKHADCGLVLCKSYILDENNLEIVGELKRNVNQEEEDGLFKDLILERNVYFAPGGYMIRTSSLEKVLPDRQIYSSRGGQNWQILLPLTYQFKCGYIDEFLFSYLMRDNSHSRTAKSYKEEIERYDAHEDIILNTIETINNMSPIEKSKWFHIVIKKYVRLKMKTAFRYTKRNDVEYYYNVIKQWREVELEDKIIFIRNKYTMIDTMISVSSKIVKKVARKSRHRNL